MHDRSSFGRRTLATLALLALAACGYGQPTMGSAEDELAIREAAAAYGQAYEARDPEALAQLLTEDYQTVMPDGQVVSGREAAKALVAQDMAMIPEGAAVTMAVTTDVFQWLGPDAAVAGGTWTLSGMTPDGGAMRGSWLSTYVREDDGRWRMSSGLGTTDTPPPPAPAGS